MVSSLTFLLHQMWRDPAKAMELKDVKPGQGL